MAITYRNTKGSALTYNELDANFSSLNQERTASTFTATGRTVRFGTGKDLHLSSSGSESSNSTTTFINISGGFYYAYPQTGRKGVIQITSSLNNNECGMLLFVAQGAVTSISAPTGYKWVNNSTGLGGTINGGSSNTSANGWGAPSNTSNANEWYFGNKLFSLWRDSSGDGFIRYHGRFGSSTGSTTYPDYGYVHIP